MNTKTNNGSKKNAVKSNGNGKAKAKPVKTVKPVKTAKPVKKAAKSKAAKTVTRYFLFEQPISHIVHRLGKLGWKPSAAFNAISRTKGNAGVSPKATSSQIYSGRNRKPTDKQLGTLSKAQLAQLTKLSLVGAKA